MKRKWTEESASTYLVKATYHGLKWCSAYDFLNNHTGVNVHKLLASKR